MVDVGQSIREDSNYARTHGLLPSVITTLNLHKFDHAVMLTLGNVHHFTHPLTVKRLNCPWSRNNDHHVDHELVIDIEAK